MENLLKSWEKPFFVFFKNDIRGVASPTPFMLPSSSSAFTCLVVTAVRIPMFFVILLLYIVRF
jgi:hypothetical protein